METLKAMAAWFVLNTYPQFRVRNPAALSLRLRRFIMALSIVFAICSINGTALGQNVQWAKQAGGTSRDEGTGVAVDGSGNSYVTGYFEGTATFGLGEANQTILTAAGSEDIFVAKYDSSGLLQWAKRAGGSSSEEGYGIAVDDLGNSYVTGGFAGTPTFGAGEANQTILTAAGDRDIFVAKYNSSGLLQWAKRAGEPSVRMRAI